MDKLTYSFKDGVAVITLDDGKANALSVAMIAEIRAAITQAEADPVISALNLKRTPASLNYYQKEESHLVVSGIGKCNAAAACGCSIAFSNTGNDKMAFFFLVVV